MASKWVTSGLPNTRRNTEKLVEINPVLVEAERSTKSAMGETIKSVSKWFLDPETLVPELVAVCPQVPPWISGYTN